MESTAHPPVRRTERTHAVAIEMMRRFAPSNVLDAACGNGELAAKLLKLGLRVTCLDFSIDACFPEGAQGLRADLDRDLPISAATFDGVFCIEGIEHLENPHHLLRELHRVLKPNGFLILSTPNILSLRSRWKYLMTGRFSKFSDFRPQPGAVTHLVRGHLNPVGYPELEYGLVLAGFAVKEVRANNLKGHSRFVAGCARLLMRWRKPKHHPHHESLLTDDLLFGENIVVLAQRS